jgi:methyl-accepting chemotaxis protein
MTKFRNTKNSRDASILPKIIFAPTAIAAAVLALGFEVFLVRHAGEDGAFLPLLAGGIVNIVILVLGCLASCLVIRGLFHRLQSLETLTKPLSEGDYTALAALSGNPVSGTPAAGADSAVPALRESLVTLGKFLTALEGRIANNRKMKETLDSEAAEQDAVLRHLEEAVETITKQFYDIETQSKQGIEVLENLGTCIKDLNDTAEGQPGPAGDPGRRSRAVELSESLAGRIGESSDRAEKVKETVDAGEEQARETSDLIKAIVREVDTIAGMINVINQISEQTNILSMNAAIESAHAGQAGAGFAVVADEIRKLADSARENAGRIHEELKEITGKTGEALKAGEDSFQTFNGVSGEAGRLAKELAEIAAVLEAGPPNDDPGEFRGDNALLQERMKESISGVMAHYQGLKTGLEQIGDLSGGIRTGIKEIHSGTREILENIHTARRRFLRHLEEAEDLEKIFPPAVPAAPPAAASPPAARIPPRDPAPGFQLRRGETQAPKTDGDGKTGGTGGDGVVPAPAAGEGHMPAGEIPKKDYSDSREVTVKKPPQLIP